MIPITINIGDFAREIALSPKEVDSFARYTLDKLVTRYGILLDEQINSKLKSTRSSYSENLSFEYVDDYNATITLHGIGTGKLALMMEKGHPAFNMKDAFFKSAKAKTGKDGKRYFTIPFKHATSEAIAASATFSGGKMPKDIQLKASSEPLKFKDLPGQHQAKGIRQSVSRGGVTTPTYEHKAPIYQGLVKKDTPSHQGHFTFRRASENNPDSFYHPGFDEQNLMGKALDGLQVDRIVAQAKEEFLNLKFGL